MKTRKRRRHYQRLNNASCKASQEEYPEYLQLWTIRILWDLGGHHKFLQRNGFSDDTVALAIGLGEWDDTSKSNSENIKLNRDKLRDLYFAKIDSLSPSLSHNVLTNNIKNVAKIVCLGETDCRILEFSILLQTEKILVRAVECLGDLSLAEIYHALSIILDLPLESIKASLKHNSVLARTGLVSVINRGPDSLDCKLDIISLNFADLAISDVMDPIELLRGQVSRRPGILLK